MKQLVIFDMDGTLANTSAGILNSHRYVHRMMGRAEPEDAELTDIIGGPLLQSYKVRFGFTEEDARRAVTIYRSYYAEKGIHEAHLYHGIREVLITLKAWGAKLGVATLKAERFAKIMLQELGIDDLFDVICGMDEHDTCTKASLIERCMRTVGVTAKQTILVGDSVHDLNGAHESGVSFCAVTYGFGFTCNCDGIPPCFAVCHSPQEIPACIVAFNS